MSNVSLIGKFQFHTGSIKRIAAVSALDGYQVSCFNSILVRLKVESTSSKRSKRLCFNSILVRLKVYHIPRA